MNPVSTLGSPVCIGARCCVVGLVRGRGHGIGKGLDVQLVRVVKEHVDGLRVFRSRDDAVAVR